MALKHGLLAVAIILFTGVVAISAIALGSALSRKNNNTQTVSLVSQPTANVQITDQGFVPSDLQVKPGTVVTWTNTTTNNYMIDSNPYPTHTSLPGLASATIP
ncbi:MAG TPA: hypothetical protein VGS28_03955, partial [Candidatus Saccharimonadales bacterium]|nr:hypothetical protein [Candidatus Saccharimonadales bacterium]